MIKKGRPADKDKYVHIVLDLLIRKQSSSLTPFMMDLMAVGLNKMTCLELAVIACRLGYQAEYLLDSGRQDYRRYCQERKDERQEV
jgi:hypothetical protein